GPPASAYDVLGAGLLRQSPTSASNIQLSFVGAHNNVGGAFGTNRVCACIAELSTPSLGGTLFINCFGHGANFEVIKTLAAIACPAPAAPASGIGVGFQ